MNITITPRDIIERGLWPDYEFYMLATFNMEGRVKIIKENVPFEITENDAYVIGLLKVIYTENVCHKFNSYILNALNVKVFDHEKRMYISRDVIQNVIEKFEKKFPKGYEPNNVWEAEIEKYKIYSARIVQEIDTLKTIIIKGYNCIQSKDIKKILNPHE